MIDVIARRPRTFTAQDGALLAASAVSGLAFSWLLFKLTPVAGTPGFVIIAYAAFCATYWLVVRELQGNVAARDRLSAVVIGSAAVAVIVPLILIVGHVLVSGVKAFGPNFFLKTQEGIGPLSKATDGGGLHAIVGTLEQVAMSVLICVPLGVLAAVFLNEVGGKATRPIRFVVDAMSGVPSIVAGLFIYAVWLIQFGQDFSGFAASLALSVLMLPTVIRTAEEVLRLIPGGLREAALALGAPEWRMVLRVVLPTARTGLITAVILGVARAVGETAPLIMTSFGSPSMNANLFKDPQSSLPLFIYSLIRSPYPEQIDVAWTGALVLISLVLILFTLARVLGRKRSSR